MKTRFRWLAILACTLFIGACASGPPAPVVDHSIGKPPPPPEPEPRSEVPTTYTVARGDSLYTIAFKHGLDWRALAVWNGIAPPYTIYPGQQLSLQPVPGQPTAVVTQSAPPVETRPPASAASAPPAAPKAVFEPPQTSPVETQAPKTEQPVSQPAAPAPDEPARADVTQSPAANANVVASAARTAGGIAWSWPAKGALVGSFQDSDPSRQGLDIAGATGDPVRAAADGVVIYSGNGLIGYGELVIVKHSDSFMSAYGHNSKRLVKEGERVRAGQQIARMGSSGSPRTELHFEIRRDGKPVNPMDYLPGR